MADGGRARWSVRTRIVASILAVSALGLAVAGATAYLVQRERILASVDSQLSHTVDNVRFVAAGHQLTGAPDAPPVEYATLRELLRAVVQQLVPRSNEATLGIVNGKPAYEPGFATAFELADDPAFVARVTSEAAAGATGTDDDGAGAVVRGTATTRVGHLRYVAVPVNVEGDPEQGVFVAAYDLDAELSALTDAFRTYALVALVALVAVGLVGWFVAGRLLRPIRTLRDTAERISLSDLSERIPVRGHDDVSELTVTVNDMLDRLHTSARAQQQLLDDVGHELKTPLTIIRGHLELMDVRDPAEVASTRALVLDELDRTTGLVADISLLAAVQRPQSLRPRPVELAGLAAQVTRKAAGLSDRHEWVGTPAPAVTVVLDVDRVTQAWLQLAANAAQHAPDGSTITLAAAATGDRLHLSVTDAGPGIDPAAQARVFERFARVGEGRGEEGSGLGLAIVSAIAQAHGGQVTLASTPGAGSTFTIELPRVAPPSPAGPVPPTGSASPPVPTPEQPEATWPRS